MAQSTAARSQSHLLLETLEASVMDRVGVFRRTAPEEDETWESWYDAAFDMLTAELRSIFEAFPASPAPAKEVRDFLSEVLLRDPDTAHPNDRDRIQDQHIALARLRSELGIAS